MDESPQSHAEALEAELDQVLRRQIDADETTRRLKRELGAAEDFAGDLVARAQRLRLAIFALDGKGFVPGIVGDANSANHERLMELQRDARAKASA